jgi:hypothetical protein
MICCRPASQSHGTEMTNTQHVVKVLLSNSVRFLGSLLPGPGRGTSTPALFIDVFRSSDSTGLRPYPRRFPELAFFPPFDSSGLRLSSSGSVAA